LSGLETKNLEIYIDAAFMDNTNDALFGQGSTYIGYYSSNKIAYCAVGGTVTTNSNLSYNNQRHMFHLNPRLK
jgi:hypothetical protein